MDVINERKVFELLSSAAGVSHQSTSRSMSHDGALTQTIMCRVWT